MSTYVLPVEGDHSKVLISPGVIPDHKFNRFRQIMTHYGYGWIKHRNGYVGHLPFLDELLTQLRADHFNFEVTDRMIAAVEAQIAEIHARNQATVTRITTFAMKLRILGRPPWPFQVEDAIRMCQTERILNANPVGLGKTLEVLAALPEDARCVMLAPKTIKHLTWVDEINLWRPDLRQHMVDNAKDFRWPEPGEIVLVHPQALPDGTPAPPAGVYFVFDEAHQYSNYDSNRTKRLRSVSQRVRKKGGSVWALTGTPLDEPMQLWALLVNLGLASELFPDQERFRELMGGYRERIVVGVDSKGQRIWRQVWKWKPQDVSPEVQAIVAPYIIRREREEVRPQMPEGIRIKVKVPLSDRSMKKFMDILMKQLENVPDEDLMKTLLAGGGDIFSLKEFLARSKIPATIEQVEQLLAQREQVLVGTCYKEPAETIAKRFGGGLITGDTPIAERDRLVKTFQAKQLPVLVMTYDTGGQGITCNAACQSVSNDLDWRPLMMEQFEGRTLRGDQKRTCYFRIMEADHPLERRIHNRLEYKREFAAAVLQGIPFVRPVKLDQLTEILHGLYRHKGRFVPMQRVDTSEYWSIVAREASQGLLSKRQLQLIGSCS